MTTHAERVPCTHDHLSDYGRVKVDIAQTSFFRGMNFRTFKEFTVATGTSYVVKIVTLGNVILHGLNVAIEDGALRVLTKAGGTDGGGFSDILPIFNSNNMSVGPDREALIPSVTTLAGGGTHTGGTTLDVLRLKTANATSGQTTVGAGVSDERGIAMGTYYFVFENIGIGSVTGIFSLRWEER